MKITNVSGPLPVQSTTSNSQSPLVQRAIAVASGQAVGQQKTVQEFPVADANNISMEEMGAIKAKPADISVDSESADTESVQEVAAKVEEQKPKDEALSRQFAQLARQEKALRAKQLQQEQAYKAREEALAAKEKELSAQANKYKDGYISREELKKNTLAKLSEAGISWDELTNQILNQSEIDPRTEALINSLEAKIKALEEGVEGSKKAQEEQQKQAYQSAVKQIETDARNLVNSDPNFETIKAMGSTRDVVELITETFNKDGILLSVEEAAQQVEDYLVEEALKISRIGKIKSRLEQSVAKTAQAQKQVQAPVQKTQPQMKTLTNATASTRKLTASERAVLAFKGELK